MMLRGLKNRDFMNVPELIANDNFSVCHRDIRPSNIMLDTGTTKEQLLMLRRQS